MVTQRIDIFSGEERRRVQKFVTFMNSSLVPFFLTCGFYVTASEFFIAFFSLAERKGNSEDNRHFEK